jgi:hypothetical protein
MQLLIDIKFFDLLQKLIDLYNVLHEPPAKNDASPVIRIFGDFDLEGKSSISSDSLINPDTIPHLPRTGEHITSVHRYWACNFLGPFVRAVFAHGCRVSD